jgi:hypothetical protein
MLKGVRGEISRTDRHIHHVDADDRQVRRRRRAPVPLSDHEQRLLDEIEQALYAEDPKFASHVRSARARSRTRRDVLLCITGGILGLGLVLVGLITTVIVVSVIGFVLLLASCGWAAQMLVNRSRGSSGSTPSGGTTPGPRQPRQTGLRTRMEDRLRRRFDEE